MFDEAGVNVYPENVFAPYMVRVKISDLKMRLGATIDTASVGHIPMGSYTIVEEKYGKVSKSGEEGLWGRIKSEQPYQRKIFLYFSAFPYFSSTMVYEPIGM